MKGLLSHICNFNVEFLHAILSEIAYKGKYKNAVSNGFGGETKTESKKPKPTFSVAKIFGIGFGFGG